MAEWIESLEKACRAERVGSLQSWLEKFLCSSLPASLGECRVWIGTEPY